MVLSTRGGRALLNRFLRGISLYLLIAILAVTVVTNIATQPETVREASYSEFNAWVNEGRVTKVRMVGDQEIHGELVDGTSFQTIIPPGTTNLADQLIERGVEVNAEKTPPPPWWIAL